VYAPDCYIFCAIFLTNPVVLKAGVQIQFYAQKFPLYCFKRSDFPVRLTDGLQIEFQAIQFPFNCIENSSMGTLLFPQLYYLERDVYAPD
jgi:hypothetical protein